MPRKPGDTVYSSKIKGKRDNHHWPVKFDLIDDCLGITQFGLRVLLSGNQVEALLQFLRENKFKRSK